jgi:hypothetical protein
MNDLKGAVGELNMTVTITRKETGKVEEFKLTGFLDEQQLKELQNGGYSLNGGEECGN